MLNNSRRFLRGGLHSGIGRILALGSVMLLVVGLCGSLLQPGVSIAQAAPRQRWLPTNLTNRQAHPGSVLVAFRVPVRASGNHFGPGGSGGTPPSSSELNKINGVLDGLHTT